MPGGHGRGAAAACALLALTALAPGTARAQEGEGEAGQTRLGVGYVANVPNMFVGASAHFIPAGLRGWGVYADVKFDIESPADDEGFIEGLTVEQVDDELGHERSGQEGSWSSVNLALVRTLSPELALYAGGGVGWRKEYRQYFDPDRELGVSGLYWVEDTGLSGTYLNGMAGVMLRLTSSVTAHFGAETAPPGFTLGLSLTLPQ